jgi:hypothetical protein
LFPQLPADKGFWIQLDVIEDAMRVNGETSPGRKQKTGEQETRGRGHKAARDKTILAPQEQAKAQTTNRRATG